MKKIRQIALKVYFCADYESLPCNLKLPPSQAVFPVEGNLGR